MTYRLESNDKVDRLFDSIGETSKKTNSSREREIDKKKADPDVCNMNSAFIFSIECFSRLTPNEHT